MQILKRQDCDETASGAPILTGNANLWSKFDVFLKLNVIYSRNIGSNLEFRNLGSIGFLLYILQYGGKNMNVERNLPVVRERKLEILKGDPELCAQQKKAGKLIARERIGLLLDAAPYGAMLALAAGSGLVFFRKRRRED